MGSTNYEQMKPHVVCIPYPAQGHVNPMLKLAKLLHQNGFHVTFVNTDYNHRRLLKSRGGDALDGLPDFRFATITDGLPLSDADATQDIPSLCVSTTTTCLEPFCDLLSNLNNSGVPPVSCTVSDGVMSFTLKAAERFGLPEVLFWTTSACGLLGYTHYRNLVDKGYIPLQVGGFLTHCGWNSILESMCNGVPMLCWQFFADQYLNCKYACEEWGVGMEIKSDVERDEVGVLVRELMDGERGKMLRKRAVEWKDKAAAAVASGGSSCLNLDRLINEILCI